MTVVLLALVFEGYLVAVGLTEGQLPVPGWFGNRVSSGARLSGVSADRPYRFLVVGDTKASGTFEALMESLPEAGPDFVVLLGDLVGRPTETEHAFLRAELEEADSPAPVFSVPGNHDVDPEGFPLVRFERFYGPARFRFTVGPDLFLLLPLYTDNEDGGVQAERAADFLEEALEGQRQRYRYVFLFGHSPAGIYPGWERPQWPAYRRLAELIRRYRVTAVFTGHLHRFSVVRAGETEYFVSGGGGASLKGVRGVPGFYHALVADVSPEAVRYTLFPLPRRRDVEDKIEYWVIARFWPWVRRQVGVFLAGNLLAGVAVVMVLRRRAGAGPGGGGRK